MRIDLDQLRLREDNGCNAVRRLNRTEKWAALQVLVAELGVRITQIDIESEKLKAFKSEMQL